MILCNRVPCRNYGDSGPVWRGRFAKVTGNGYLAAGHRPSGHAEMLSIPETGDWLIIPVRITGEFYGRPEISYHSRR